MDLNFLIIYHDLTAKFTSFRNLECFFPSEILLVTVELFLLMNW